MAEIVERRRAERDRLIGLARAYVERLSARVPVLAAAVVGSVARGDFNVWSDIDVLVVCEVLPDRVPDRMALLVEVGTDGVQPVGYTPSELRRAVTKRDPMVLSVWQEGVILVDENTFLGRGAG